MVWYRPGTWGGTSTTTSTSSGTSSTSSGTSYGQGQSSLSNITPAATTGMSEINVGGQSVLVSSGGGGGGGGGGGTPLPQSIGTPEQIAGTSGGGTQTTPRGGGSQALTPTEMKILASGKVQVGTTKYIGGAVVPFTGGKTSNQILRETQVEATKLGYSPGSWRANIPIQQQTQTFEQGQQSAGNLLWGGELPNQPPLQSIEESGNFYQQPVQTGAKGFFGRVKQRGQEEYSLLKEGTRGISGTYGGTQLQPPPYGSYAKAFFKEIPSSFPKIKTIGQNVAQDVKQTFVNYNEFQKKTPIMQTTPGIIELTKIGIKTPAFQSFKKWNAPRMEAVTSSTEFEVLSKSLVRGVAFAPPVIVGRQVFVETIPLRQRRPAYATENIKTDIIRGKAYRTSDFTIYTEKAPPRVQITRKIYQDPINIKYLPKITSATRTPYGASSTDSFITLEMKGGKVGSLSKVEGTSQAIETQEILSYQKLSAPKRLLVERLAQSKAGGTPVSGKWIQKMMKQDNQRFFSQIDITKIGKARLTPSGVQLEPIKPIRIGSQRKPLKLYGESKYSSPLGKTKTRYEAITETKILKETEMYSSTKSRVIFKDVTYPTGRLYKSKIKEVKDLIPQAKVGKDYSIYKGNEGLMGQYSPKEGIYVKGKGDIQTALHELFHQKSAKVSSKRGIEILNIKQRKLYIQELKQKGTYKQLGELGYKKKDVPEEFLARVYESGAFAKKEITPQLIEKIKIKKFPETTKVFKKLLKTEEFSYPSLVKYKEGAITGKTTELKVYGYENKIPNVLDDFKDVNIIKSSDIDNLKLTSLDKTFQTQVQKQPTLFVPPKVPKAISRTIVVPSKAGSYLTTIPASAYIGKGMYERTTGGQIPGVQLPSITSYSYSPTNTKTYTPSITPSATSMNQINLLKPAFKIYTGETSRGMNKEITKEITKEIQKPITKEITKIIQKPASKLILKQYQKTTSKVPQRIFTGIPTRITPRIKTPYPPPKIKQFKQPKLYPGGYTAQIRRFGEFKSVGTGNLQDVFNLGTSKTKKTLGATFRILDPSGKSVSVLPTPKTFYKKIDKKFGTLFIEKPSQRIKKRSVSKEIPELSYWKNVRSPIRKSKGGKK